MNFAPIRTDVTRNGTSIITEQQRDYLLGLDEGDFAADLNVRNWSREYYFYYGELYDSCEEIIFLTNERDGMYFIPYELFLELEEQVK